MSDQIDWRGIASRYWPNHCIVAQGNGGEFAAVGDSKVELFQTRLERRLLAWRGAKLYRLSPPAPEQPWKSAVWEKD